MGACQATAKVHPVADSWSKWSAHAKLGRHSQAELIDVRVQLTLASCHPRARCERFINFTFS